MYKGASKNLQRRLKTEHVVKPTAAYISEDDLVATADTMGLRDCELERSAIALQKAQAENELKAAKAANNQRAIIELGHKIQAFCTRASTLKARIKKLTGERRDKRFIDAASELLSDSQFRQILARRDELIAADADAP